MTGPFSRQVRNAAATLVKPETIEAALRALGDDAELSVEELPLERRAVLSARFARNLRGIGVARAKEVERVVLRAVGATPGGVEVVPIRDALSLIRARNHVDRIATAFGWPWAAGMKLQAAVCEIVRLIADGGGGILETVVAPAQASFRFQFERSIDATEPCFAGLRALGIVPEVRQGTEGHRIEFSFAGAAGA